MVQEYVDLSDRLQVIQLPQAAAESSFADDVLAGLSATPKALPPKYLYDELGSALFDAITKLPEYYLTRAETEILREWGWEIVRALDAPIDLLELGSGSAVKTRLLIEETLRVQRDLEYSPIDISPDALQSSSESLVDAYRTLRVKAYAGDYFTVLRSVPITSPRKTLVLLMGSNIGNYQPAEADELLALTAGALRPGDGLLLGTDLKKDRATLEAAYDDPTGVTAAFDKNLLARMNREFDATFDLRRFRHVARYDERRGCVDSYLESTTDQQIVLRTLHKTVSFAHGERMHMESSYKFDAPAIAALAKRAGLGVAKTWYDRSRRFCITLLTKLA